MPTDNSYLHTSLAHLVELGTRVKNVTDTAIKSATFANGTLSLFRTSDASGTAYLTVSLPDEMVLDTEKTKFEPKFKWSEAAYPGSTNPNLDDKPVIVFAVKTTTSAGAATITYMFMDVASLVDTYTAADKSITVDGYTLKVNVSAATGNLLELKEDGLYAGADDSKADKVSGATNGNFAGLDGNGNLTDSGKKATDFVEKVSGTEDNFVQFGADGVVKDGGYRMATDAEVNAALDAIFPSA